MTKLTLRLVLSLLITLMLPKPVFAQKADTWKSDLTMGGPVYTLQLFDDAHVNSDRSGFWGRFNHPFGFTSGTSLYLFPDYTALFTRWCDICEEELLAKGSFKHRNGKLTFAWLLLKKEDAPPSTLYALWGNEDRGTYVTGFEVALLTPENFERLKAGKDEFKILIRRTTYYDWKKIGDKLRAEKSSQR